MGDTTEIPWADHTWSPWLGCEPVSSGCAHCYASALSKRAGRGAYRHGMTRVLTKDWKKPLRWNSEAHELAEMAVTMCEPVPPSPRVFPSMCDPGDDAVPVAWREQFVGLIASTPYLTWLVLTKRPENLAHVGLTVLDNVWLGVSCENQEMTDERIPLLLQIPARVRFVSCEPLLGPVDIGLDADLQWCCPTCKERVEPEEIHYEDGCWLKCPKCKDEEPHGVWGDKPGIDWVIAGGESGFNHRRMELAWLQSIADQCKSAGVPFFCKQDSARLPGEQGRIPNELWSIKQYPEL